jgi:hypothetical protein
LPTGYTASADSVGTVNGTTDGAAPSSTVLSQIQLAAGNHGVNYDFYDVLMGS